LPPPSRASRRDCAFPRATLVREEDGAGQRPAGGEAAPRFKGQIAWVLLSCANNLAFCAELFGDSQQNRKPERIQDGGLVSASGVMRFHSMPSAGGGIARLVSARLLSRAGLTVEQIDNRSARLKVPSQIKFLELSATASQDDCLGFHLARDFDLREIGLLYYVLASSEILADALHKAERYSGIVNEGISLRFSERHKTAITFSYVGVERRSDRHQIEFWLTSLVRLCRQLTNRRLVPSQIRVMHNRTKTPAEFRSFLGCEIERGKCNCASASTWKSACQRNCARACDEPSHACPAACLGGTNILWNSV